MEWALATWEDVWEEAEAVCTEVFKVALTVFTSTTEFTAKSTL